MSNKFFFEVELPAYDFRINHKNNIMFVGSCFAENTGTLFQEHFFNSLINPFGVLYNPVSIAAFIEQVLSKKLLSKKDLIEYKGLWHSFLHHSSFSGHDRKKVLKKINENIEKANSFILKADFLFITLGTAFIYELKETGKIVANCHKLPASFFERRLMGIAEIEILMFRIFEKLHNLNSNLKIVLTISPVRHLKDGAIGNNLSKSSLIVATQRLVNKLDFVYYFPSYEIVLDELRDYRFYAEDLTHPNNIAVKYIWEKLNNAFFGDETKQLLKKIDKLNNALNHRPFNPYSDEFEKFIDNCEKQIDLVEKELGRIPFDVNERLEELKNMRKG